MKIEERIQLLKELWLQEALITFRGGKYHEEDPDGDDVMPMQVAEFEKIDDTRVFVKMHNGYEAIVVGDKRQIKKYLDDIKKFSYKAIRKSSDDTPFVKQLKKMIPMIAKRLKISVPKVSFVDDNTVGLMAGQGSHNQINIYNPDKKKDKHDLSIGINRPMGVYVLAHEMGHLSFSKHRSRFTDEFIKEIDNVKTIEYLGNSPFERLVQWLAVYAVADKELKKKYPRIHELIDGVLG